MKKIHKRVLFCFFFVASSFLFTKKTHHPRLFVCLCLFWCLGLLKVFDIFVGYENSPGFLASDWMIFWSRFVRFAEYLKSISCFLFAVADTNGEHDVGVRITIAK